MASGASRFGRRNPEDESRIVADHRKIRCCAAQNPEPYTPKRTSVCVCVLFFLLCSNTANTARILKVGASVIWSGFWVCNIVDVVQGLLPEYGIILLLGIQTVIPNPCSWKRACRRC